MNRSPDPKDEELPVSVQLRIDEVCLRFEEAWRGEQRPALEEYMADTPEPERTVLCRELVALEFEYRRRAGESPQREEYEARFPYLDLTQLAVSSAAPVKGKIACQPLLYGRTSNGVTPSNRTADVAVRCLRCPHCHHPIPLAEESPDEVVCPGCGGSFRLREACRNATHGSMRILGKFDLLERVGLGAFGSVWRARDTTLDKIVALKIPHTGLLTEEEELERFHREARAAAQLRHPGIVTVHEVVVLDGLPTIVGDFIEGVSLKDFLEVRRLTFREAAGLVAEVAEAMDYAHQMGLVHRDIKPANIMIESARVARSESSKGVLGLEAFPGTPFKDSGRATQLGKALVMDFGLALRGDAEVTMTQDGHILGTPAYMSPEQAAGRSHQADRRSDVYSLGVILYELVCGELPFRGSKMMILHQTMHEEPRLPRKLNHKIPRDLETVCLKALAKEPGRRYATARDMADDLLRFLDGQPIKARPVPVWERCWTWAKRRPGAAALVGVSGLAALALVGLAVGTWYNGQLQAALQVAEWNRTEAEQHRKRIEALELNIRYVRDIHLAHQAWQDAHLGQTLKLLDRWLPSGENPLDLRGWEWYYLRGLCHKDFRTLQAQPGTLFSVAFHPDGRRIAVADHSERVHVWDVIDGRKMHTLRVPGTGFNEVAFSPDGRQLAAACLDGTVRCWDVANGKETCSLRGGIKVYSVAFSPNGRYLASADEDNTVRLWEMASGQEVRRFVGHEGPVLCVTFSPDGGQLASSSRDGTGRLWDVGSSESLHILRGHLLQVSSIAFSPDGKTLATSSEDSTIKFWDQAAGQQIATLVGHTAWVYRVAFSPDGRQLASVSDDLTVRLWDVATRQEVRILRGHEGAYVRGVAFSPDGRLLASVDMVQAVKVWELATGPQEHRLLSGHGDRIGGVAFAGDGRRLASASKDKTVRLWDIPSGRQTHILTGHTQEVWCVAFSGDSKLLASGSFDKTVKVWNPETGEMIRTLTGHAGAVKSLAFSRDGLWLASAGEDKTVLVWDVASGQEIQTLLGHQSGVECVTFSPDGRRLASASWDKTVKLWDTGTWQERFTLQGHVWGVFNVAVSPDGSRLVTAGNHEMKVWDTASGEAIQTIQGHWGDVTCVTFSPDGRRIASTGEDRTVKVWDTASGQELLTLKGHTALVYSVAFSPDGRCLASAGAENRGPGVIRLWEAPPAEPLLLSGSR